MNDETARRLLAALQDVLNRVEELEARVTRLELLGPGKQSK